MSTLILDAPRAATLSKGWIVSKWNDLAWFVGASLVGYFALLAFSAGIPVLALYLIWNLLIDGPHLFATASRTYFDKSARSRLGVHLFALIPFLLLGPVAYLIGLGSLFLLFFLTWAQYHIAKQHVGFVMLYKKKTGERCDFNLDRRFILLSVMLPWFLCIYANAGFAAYAEVRAVTLFLFCGLVVFYIARQVRRAVNNEVINTPKLALLALVVPLHWIAFLYAAGRPELMLIASLAVNVGHSLQYHRLTWFHNQNRYANETRESVGFASVVNSRVAFYFIASIAMYGLLYAFPRYMMAGNVILVALFYGVNMTHFYIDAKIWKVSSDKDLAKALRL